MTMIKYILLLILFIIGFNGCTLSKNQLEIVLKEPTIEQKLSSETNKAPYITLQIDFGDATLNENFQFSIREFQNQDLWSIMKQALSEKNITLKYQDYKGDLGIFITQIGEQKNGNEGRYWQYWANGEYGKIGVSNYKIKPGDIVQWRFVSE